MEAKELLNAVNNEFCKGDYKGGDYAKATLETASAALPGLLGRKPNEFDAETCRIASLAAIAQKDWWQVDVWRARWVSQAVAIDWNDSIGFWLIGLALGALVACDKERLSIDDLRKIDEAKAILFEIETLLGNTDPSDYSIDGALAPTRAGLYRQLWEKRGPCSIISGQYEDAIRFFNEAAKVGASKRTKIKVGLYNALADYLTKAEFGTSADESINETKLLVAEAEAAQYVDLAAIGQDNIELMCRGLKSVYPYDIL